MTFNTPEISNQDGQPIALYTLEWGNTVWRYTSADRNITRVEGGQPRTYLAVAISDNGMVQGGDSNADFTIKAPSNLPIAALYRGTAPSASIYLTVRRKHVDDPDNEAPVFWVGTVGNVKGVDDATIEIVGRTLTASFKRSGLRLSWQKNCPHILYDSSCSANPGSYAIAGTITDLTGNSITVDGSAGDQTADWFDGGYVRWEADGNGTMERRGIERTLAPGTFAIYGRTNGLVIGQAVTLYPGCQHTPSACDGKFNNLPNYGGFPFLPGKSPFDGTPVF